MEHELTPSLVLRCKTFWPRAGTPQNLKNHASKCPQPAVAQRMWNLSNGHGTVALVVSLSSNPKSAPRTCPKDLEIKGDHLLGPLLNMGSNMGKPKGEFRSIRFGQVRP